MTLSVILPNFNHGHLIGTALDSLGRQERRADEVIVVDDASTDHSLEVIESYRQHLPNLVLLRNETNRGAIQSLQAGLEAATGDFVYFAAADDWVLPGFFDCALKILEANPRLGLCCGEAIILEGGTDRVIGHRPPVRPRLYGGLIEPADASRLLARLDNFILTGSAIYRRSAVLAKGGFDPRAGAFADGLLTRKIALAHGFHFVPRVFAVWNVFPQGLSRSMAVETERAERALREIPALIEQDPGFPSWYAPLFRDRWRFGSARLALDHRPPNLPLLLAMGARSPTTRAILAALAHPRLGRPGRLLALALLSLLWRPYPVTGLAMTTILRRMTAMIQPSTAFGRAPAASSNDIGLDGATSPGATADPQRAAPYQAERNR